MVVIVPSLAERNYRHAFVLSRADVPEIRESSTENIYKTVLSLTSIIRKLYFD